MSVLQQVAFVPRPSLDSATRELERERRRADGLEAELRARLRQWNKGASQEWIDMVVRKAAEGE
jgi:hypothetical protein